MNCIIDNQTTILSMNFENFELFFWEFFFFLLLRSSSESLDFFIVNLPIVWRSIFLFKFMTLQISMKKIIFFCFAFVLYSYFLDELLLVCFSKTKVIIGYHCFFGNITILYLCLKEKKIVLERSIFVVFSELLKNCLKLWKFMTVEFDTKYFILFWRVEKVKSIILNMDFYRKSILLYGVFFSLLFLLPSTVIELPNKRNITTFLIY